MGFEIYGLDLMKFFSTPGLVKQAASKNTNVKLDLLIDIDIINGRKGYVREEGHVTLFIDM